MGFRLRFSQENQSNEIMVNVHFIDFYFWDWPKKKTCFLLDPQKTSQRLRLKVLDLSKPVVNLLAAMPLAAAECFGAGKCFRAVMDGLMENLRIYIYMGMMMMMMMMMMEWPGFFLWGMM